MEGDEVRPLEQVVERGAVVSAGERDLAAEPLEPAGDGAADAARRRRSRPSRRGGRGRAGAPAPRCAQSPSRTERSPSGEPAGVGEHQRDGEVGGRVGEHVGRVADRDPARGRRRRRRRCRFRPRSWRSRAGRGAAAISSASTASVSSVSRPSAAAAAAIKLSARRRRRARARPRPRAHSQPAERGAGKLAGDEASGHGDANAVTLGPMDLGAARASLAERDEPCLPRRPGVGWAARRRRARMRRCRTCRTSCARALDGRGPVLVAGASSGSRARRRDREGAVRDRRRPAGRGRTDALSRRPPLALPLEPVRAARSPAPSAPPARCASGAT